MTKSEKMHKVIVETSDELIRKLEQERTRKRIPSIPDMIVTILGEHYKIPKRETTPRRQNGKDVLQKIRGYKPLHYFLILIYLALMFSIFVNAFDLPIPYVNVNFARVHTPTDYTFMQTYPPSIDGISVGNSNITIYFQVHLHADTIITENTLVNIEAEASEGSEYAKNITAIGIGFFGCNYNESDRTNFLADGSPYPYELWTGWAGERLFANTTTETMLLFTMGTDLGGRNTNVKFSEAGDKPLSIILEWNPKISVFPSSYTYQNSMITVYSSATLRATQIAYTELLAVSFVALFGIFEVYTDIAGKRQD